MEQNVVISLGSSSEENSTNCTLHTSDPLQAVTYKSLMLLP